MEERSDVVRETSRIRLDDLVFCFDLRPFPPNPNFASRVLRDIFFPPPSFLGRFEERSSPMASSTATSNSSPSASAFSSAPLRFLFSDLSRSVISFFDRSLSFCFSICTCFPNFFASRSFLFSSAFLIPARSSKSFIRIRSMCASDLTISAK